MRAVTITSAPVARHARRSSVANPVRPAPRRDVTRRPVSAGMPARQTVPMTRLRGDASVCSVQVPDAPAVAGQMSERALLAVMVSFGLLALMAAAVVLQGFWSVSSGM